MKRVILLLILISCAAQAKPAWIDRKAEGWAWYEDKKNPTQEAKEETPEAPSATSQMDIVKEELTESLNRAVLYPTESNVREYMLRQRLQIQQSERFARAWSKILLSHPELDDTIDHPTSQLGSKLDKELRRQEKEALIQRVSSKYGLAFFYEGNNPSSQAMAHVVELLRMKYHWEVLAISSDGVLIDQFPNGRADNGIMQKLGVERTPALLMIDPDDSVVIPIGYGVLALEQLESNILHQMNEEQE